MEFCRLSVTTWGHDPSEIPVTGAVSMLLDALQHSPVLVQAVGSSSTSAAAAASTKQGPDPIQYVLTVLQFHFKLHCNLVPNLWIRVSL